MKLAGPGRLLAGRYLLNAVIGRGGMGVVWQARDTLLNRDVAVKELVWPAHCSAAERQAACRRTVREARVTARLTHPNVIRIFDIVEEDGCPCIVMEYFPHGSLRDLLKKNGPRTPDQAAKVGLAVLAALRAVHAAGIVHQDVKPANILIGPDRVVLTDFGIAQADGTGTVAIDDALMGSPSYIAPERARGGPSGPAGDLWGLGATLYAAVQGHGPFDRAGDVLASLTAVVAEEPQLATRAGPLLWPVISGLLRKHPDQRLGAVEAERMLRRVGAVAVPTAAVGAAGVVIGRPRRRGRALALAGSVTLALIVASGTTAVLAPTPPAAGVGGHPAAPHAPAKVQVGAHISSAPARDGDPDGQPQQCHGGGHHVPGSAGCPGPGGNQGPAGDQG